MEFAIALEVGGWGVLIVGAVIFGVALQLIGDAEFGYEWVVTAVAAFIGGLAASEFVVDWRAFEPTFGGLAIVPALIGGLVVGLVVEAATRLLTGGSYLGTAPAHR